MLIIWWWSLLFCHLWKLICRMTAHLIYTYIFWCVSCAGFVCCKHNNEAHFFRIMFPFLVSNFSLDVFFFLLFYILKKKKKQMMLQIILRVDSITVTDLRYLLQLLSYQVSSLFVLKRTLVALYCIHVPFNPTHLTSVQCIFRTGFVFQLWSLFTWSECWEVE